MVINPASNLCFHCASKMQTKCYLNNFYLFDILMRNISAFSALQLVVLYLLSLLHKIKLYML